MKKDRLKSKGGRITRDRWTRRGGKESNGAGLAWVAEERSRVVITKASGIAIKGVWEGFL